MLRQSRKELTATVSLRLARFWRQTQSEYNAYRAEEAILFREKGDFDEAHDQYVLPRDPAAREAFVAELKELQSDEIELKVRPFDFDDIKAAGPSADDILALEAIGLLVVDWDELEGETAVPEPSANGHKEPETA